MARDESVSIHVKASPLAWKIHFLVHLTAGALVLFYPASLPVKAVVLALVVLSWVISRRRIKQQMDVNKLQLSRERNFIWLGGEKRECEINGNPFVHHWLTTLSLRLQRHGGRQDRKIHLVFLPDSAPEDELRKLRVFLLTRL